MKCLVIGDLIYDVFVTCESAHLAQEGPFICANYKSEELFSGGAHAVYENARLLFGDDVTRFITNPFISTTKHRYFVDGHEMFRIDTHEKSDHYAQGQATTEADVAEAICGYDVVLIADYGKGVVTDRLLALCNGAKKVFLDPHPSKIPYLFFKPTVYFPNRHEAKIEEESAEGCTTWDCRIVTKDAAGVTLQKEASWTETDYPSLNDHPRQVIGAGGAFMAAYAFVDCHQPESVEEVKLKFASSFVAEAMTHKWRCVNTSYKVEHE